MEFMVVTVIFVTISTLTILNFLIHKTRCGRLIDKIPGPRFLPVVGNGLDVSVPLEELWRLLRRYARDYYPVYKLWVCHWPIVYIRHPDDVEILLSNRKNITKSLFYDLLHPWLGTGLLTSTGSKWRQRRKILTPAFHFNLLHDFVEVFVETSERMVNILKEEGGAVVKDVVPFLAEFSLNAICETAMGTTLQKNDLYQEKYRHSVKRMGDYFYYRATRPWLKSDWIFSLTQMGRQHAADINILHRFTTEVGQCIQLCYNVVLLQNQLCWNVDELICVGQFRGVITSQRSRHMQGAGAGKVLQIFLLVVKTKLAMLDLLIAAQKKQGIMDDRGIREEVDTFIFEGHDTTNISMSFAVLLLAENKEIQERARDEIRSVLKESNEKWGMAELQNMTYLDCCVKEALRLYPAVPSISRNLTEDVQLNTFVLPSGITAAVNVYDVHRDPNFWSNPEVFDPDRFLPEKVVGRHPFSYIPFSAGPRNCIGQKYAMLEFKAFIGQILHNFYLEPMMETSSVRMLPDLILKSLHPLNVKFIPIQ